MGVGGEKKIEKQKSVTLKLRLGFTSSEGINVICLGNEKSLTYGCFFHRAILHEGVRFKENVSGRSQVV